MDRTLLSAIVLTAFGTTLIANTRVTPNPQQSNPNYEVKTSDAATPSPSVVWLDLESLSPAARQKLLPLYEQEYGLLQQLDAIKWQALRDTMGGFFTVGAAVVATPPAANRVAEDSAALAGQFGAKSEGTSAPLAAQSPVEMYASVTRAMDLLTQIGSIEKEILSVRKSFSINPSAQTPWDKLFPKSKPKMLTPNEVKNLLTPAANGVVPASCSFIVGYADGCLSSCLHLCNFGGPDPGCNAKCQSDYVKQLAYERRETAKCIAQSVPR